MDITDIRKITGKLKQEKYLKRSKETDSTAEYIYESSNYKYYTYDSPHTSLETLTRRTDDKVIFSHRNGKNTINK